MSLNNFNYPVSWSDFTQRNARPSGENEDAYIFVRYGYSFQMQRNGNAVTIASADVNITISSSDCWVVTSQMTNYLLKHEQGHYDITALGAREFYNALMNLFAASPHALQNSITQLNERYQQKIKRANMRYDTKTRNSQDTQAQQTWDQGIAAEMQMPGGSIDNLPQ